MEVRVHQTRLMDQAVPGGLLAGEHDHRHRELRRGERLEELSAESGEKLTPPPPAAGRPYYELSSCGRYWLQVQGNEATGKINGEEEETVPLFDVIRWLVEGAKAPLGRGKQRQAAGQSSLKINPVASE